MGVSTAAGVHIAVFGLALLVSTLLVRTWRGTGERSEAPPWFDGLVVAVALLLPLGAGIATDLFEGGLAGRLGLPGLGALLGGALTVLSLGLHDDLAGARRYEKAIVLAVVSLTLWTVGVRVEDVPANALENTALDPWLSWLLTTVWIITATASVHQLLRREPAAVLVLGGSWYAFAAVGGLAFGGLGAAAVGGAVAGSRMLRGDRLGAAGTLSAGLIFAVVALLDRAVGLSLGALALTALITALPLRRPARRTLVAVFLAIIALAAAALVALVSEAERPTLMAGIGVAVVTGVLMAFLPRRDASLEIVASPEESPVPRTLSVVPVAAAPSAEAVRTDRDLDALWLEVIRTLEPAGATDVRLEIHLRETLSWRFVATPRRTGATILWEVPLWGETHRYGHLLVTMLRGRTAQEERVRELAVQHAAEQLVLALEDRLAPELRKKLVIARLPLPRRA